MIFCVILRVVNGKTESLLSRFSIQSLKRWLLNVKYVSLVNLIADREVVTELVADTFSVANIRMELGKILSGPARETMLAGYQEVRRRLGDQCAPDETARLIVSLLNNNQSL